MTFTIEQLRTTSDEEIIKIHDALAVNASGGVDFYLNELRRRETLAAMRESHKLAKASLWLTVANAALALVAAIVAVIALSQ